MTEKILCIIGMYLCFYILAVLDAFDDLRLGIFETKREFYIQLIPFTLLVPSILKLIKFVFIGIKKYIRDIVKKYKELKEN